MKRVIIDTDPGIDDTAAIFFALSSGKLQVEALTTVFGNVNVEYCTRNALKILEVAGRSDIPVYRGASRPLVREPRFAPHVHGENGLGDILFEPAKAAPASEKAVEAIVSRVMSAPNEITLIALGPMTNVALALTIEPRLANNLNQLILMGGAVLTWGNVTPAASANLYNDPEAARIVYQSNAPIVQIGLDVCRRTLISHHHLEQIDKAGNDIGHFLQQMTPFIEEAYRKRGIKTVVEGGGVHYNDVPAIAYAIDPALFEAESLPIQIETQGALTAGQTVADFDGVWGQKPNAVVCLNVDAPAVADLFAQSIADYDPAVTGA